ncbi:hypothetical protein ABLO18_16100 [Mycobacterium tuberculosis]
MTGLFNSGTGNVGLFNPGPGTSGCSTRAATTPGSAMAERAVLGFSMPVLNTGAASHPKPANTAKKFTR